MAYTPLFMIFISCMLFLLQLLPTITAQYIASNCTYNSSVTNSITYLANLDNLLLSLSSNANATSGTGFYYDTAGDGSDKVYGLYLCRGDLTLQECQTCVKNASVEIKSNCPNTTAAVTWYVDCMLRYTNVSFFSTLQQEPFRYGAAPNDVTKVDQYNQTVGELMNGLMNQAVDGSTTPRYYAAGAVTYYTKIDTVYGLVQCTPDITQDDCKNCLTGSISIDLLRLIYPKEGGKILKPSCNIRFEFNDQFYHEKVTSTVTDGNGKRRNSRVVIIVIVVVVVIVATFITIIIISNLYLRVRRKKQKQKLRVEDDQIEISSVDSLQFNFDTIRSATNNFSDANKLGQGGFGAVYKGMLLDGQMVAVKRLSRNSNQGEIEFKNELILVAKLQHRNLVRILGFCLEGEEKLLIYEFVPNRSLDHFIFDPIERSKLVWEERYKIIEGIARGLLYLHEDSRLKIIHRDLKASNILLDEVMNPKIADFGMARLFVVDQSRVNTNRIVGTYGYMAPEYIIQGQVSVQIDVFSFGVLLLEIVTGQRSSNVGQSDGSMAGGLLSYAWKKWTEGKASELIDPSLGENYDMSEVMRCIHIGILCVQENASNRPSMASVVVMLNSYSTSLPLPTSAAFVMGSAAFVMGSEIALGKPSMDDSRVKNSKNEMSVTDLSGR